jgi:hypothetical protein
MGSPPEPGHGPGPGLGQPASDALFEPGAAQPRPPRSGSVAEPRDALVVAALDPAPHGGGAGAEELSDGAGRGAMEGPQDHEQAQGEAQGTVEKGQELGVIGDRGRCEDVL